MEKQDQATQNKGVVICPNCGSSQMEEVRNPPYGYLYQYADYYAVIGEI